MKNDNKNAAMVGVTGAVVGAGIAAATVAVLSDKKNRDAILQTVSDVKDHVMESMKNSGTKLAEIKDSIKDNVEDEESKIKKAVKK